MRKGEGGGAPAGNGHAAATGNPHARPVACTGRSAAQAETTNAPCGASVVQRGAGAAYQKNCRRASRMFGLSATKPRALEEYFLLSTIT